MPGRRDAVILLERLMASSISLRLRKQLLATEEAVYYYYLLILLLDCKTASYPVVCSYIAHNGKERKSAKGHDGTEKCTSLAGVSGLVELL